MLKPVLLRLLSLLLLLLLLLLMWLMWLLLLLLLMMMMMMQPVPPTTMPAHPSPYCQVQCYQAQSQWDNRACPRVHGAFADLWGTNELWTSFDMLHMKPPARPAGSGDPGFVHWDLGAPHLAAGLHLRLQGGATVFDWNCLRVLTRK
jgi:hypothetical protein